MRTSRSSIERQGLWWRPQAEEKSELSIYFSKDKQLDSATLPGKPAPRRFLVTSCGNPRHQSLVIGANHFRIITYADLPRQGKVALSK